MLTKNRLLYLWCALTVGIVFIAILPGGNSIYQLLAAYDANRWVHFLAYAWVVAIPVAAWRRAASILLSLVPAIFAIALEAVQAHIPGPIVRTSNIPADLFGVAAGVLLGLNLRMMRNSAKLPGREPSDSPRSVTY